MSKRILVTRKVIFVIVLASLIFSGCATPATPAATQPPANEPTAAPVVAEPTKPPVAEPTKPPAPTEAKAALTPDRLVPEIIFTFSTAEHDPVRNEIGLMLTSEWQKLGLRVNAQPMDYGAYIKVLQSGQGYNAFTNGYDGRPERLDPDVLLYRVFYSKGDNYQGYNNPAYDAVVDAQRAEMNVDKRKELVFQAQEILANDLPAIALYSDWDVDVYNSDLFDNVQTFMGAGVYNYWTLLTVTPKTDQKYLRIGHNELPDNLNPFFNTNGGATETMREIYDMLARVGTDGLPKPCAAESWKVVDDKTVEVTLRQGMKFSDGVPVTAKDVKYSYDVQKVEGSSLYKPFLAPIDSIDVVDDYHLVFHLVRPYAPLFTATFAQIYILPEHIWSKVPDPKKDFDNDKTPVGSGPFKLDYWRQNEELKVSTNKDYQFPPKIDGYYLVQYANPDATFQALMNQDVQMHADPLNAAQVEQAKNIPYLTLMKTDSHSIRYVGFNVRIPPFDDPKFRDAIGYTVNYDTIINVMLNGMGTPGKGFIAPANAFWHDPNQKTRSYDPAKARELLAAAGYEWDDQGRMYMPVK